MNEPNKQKIHSDSRGDLSGLREREGERERERGGERERKKEGGGGT